MKKNLHRVACGRIVGRSHSSTGTPCQDFVSVYRNTRMACIALADGAGSRSKSEIGAEAVVREVLRAFLPAFDEFYELCCDSPADLGKIILEKLIAVLTVEANQHLCEIDALASTLLFVVHKGNRFIAGHIGDGVIAKVDETGTPQILSFPTNGEYANTTVFVTDMKAAEHFRLYCGETNTNFLGFVIMSDGCAESLYDKKTAQPASAIKKLLSWNVTQSRQKIKSIIMNNLEQAFSKKSSDDCSLALMSFIEDPATL